MQPDIAGAAQRNQVEGTVSAVLFRNEENGYTVLKLDCGERGEITAVGCMPGAAPGEALELEGSWGRHPSYGEQFKAEVVTRRMPVGEKAIFEYLASGVVKGVRMGLARQIVDRFGEDALAVIENEPDKLCEIRGVSPKRARAISEDFRQKMGMRRLAEFLSEHRLPLAAAMPLYQRFGDYAVEVVRDNPYLLADRTLEIPFAQVDELAIGLGVAGDDPQRVEAALIFELDHNADNGHVFLPENKLLTATAALIGVEGDCLAQGLDGLIERGEVVREDIAGVTACYPAGLYGAECYVAMRLGEMCRTEIAPPEGLGRLIDAIQKEQGIRYAKQQRTAVELCASRQVMLLTGGPGTGKTTSLRGVLALFETLGLETALTAPTGRAAKRMGETCGTDALTIHRLLETKLDPFTGQLAFTKNQDDPLEVDAVIVDETSMVDVSLMAALLAALRGDCRLVLVGDPDQLPSVGPGNVLDHLIRSGAVPAVSLTEIFRQARESAIVMNAHGVNRGDVPELNNKARDFFYLGRRDAARTVDTVVELCKTRLPQNMGIPPEQIQVLTPTRKRGAGTAALNRALQEALNPAQEGRGERAFGPYIFREGDRVMQVKNNYDLFWENPDTGEKDLGVFNGDIGTIVEVDVGGITVSFEGRLAAYPPELLGELEPAYAVTVHKAQGSEYRAVILALSDVPPSLLARGVLYTAITRARELFILVGDGELMARMVANDRQMRRYSALRTRLLRETGQEV
ncbi:MAG: ATP-dependent RecD-like DNA helicase [Oscillospiraceae bacterium]|nr:ATP-dependent RecD-like DNA helicase [Oscillospiraceae bacterium]